MSARGQRQHERATGPRKNHHERRLYRLFRPSNLTGPYGALSRPAPSALYLAIWLEVGEATISIPGVVPIGRLAAAEMLRWEPVDFDRCFAELEAAGLAAADWTARLIFMPHKLQEAESAPASLTALKTYRRALHELPPCTLTVEIEKMIRALLLRCRGSEWLKHWDNPSDGEAPRKTKGESDGIQNQNQEQQQNAEKARTPSAERTRNEPRSPIAFDDEPEDCNLTPIGTQHAELANWDGDWRGYETRKRELRGIQRR
jgi:hypothetical protein